MCKPEGCKKEFCGKAAKKDQPANDDNSAGRKAGQNCTPPAQPPAAKKGCGCGC